MTKTTKCNAILKDARAFLGSTPFMFFETFAAVLIVALLQEVAGAVFFVTLLCVKLLVCDDVLSTTLPFLLLSTFLTNCYDSYDTFIVYLPAAPVVIACVVFHFVVYAKPFRVGESVYGIGAVALAVTLGGVGNFTLAQYLSGAYYIGGLGVGMIFAYLLMKSQFSVRPRYDMKERFALIMTLMGTLCTLMIAIAYFRRATGLPNGAYSQGFSRNNLCTLLMFAMPFPLYLGIKRKWCTAFTAAFFAAICVSTSRGGLLFGAVEFFVCCVFWVQQGGKKKWERAYICVISLCVILLLSGKVIWDVIANRMVADGVIEGDSRYRMIWESFANFEKNPVFGTGLLDNSIEYAGFKKKGAMAWYHMMIPQVIGSMGLLGVTAYGLQAFGRFKLVFTKLSFWSICLGISYLGVLLMSQVNPGEFCPLPFELLAVLLFVLQEHRLEEHTLPLAPDYLTK